jgi:hypothetical protein
MLVAGVVGGIFAAGLFIPGRIGGALLLLTDLVLIGMARMTWVQVRPQGRPMRVVVIAVIAVIAVVKMVKG